MNSTAGFLTLCFVLSVSLCTLMAAPVSQCKLKNLLKQMEHYFKTLNSTLEVNENHHYESEVIPELVINTLLPHHKQNETAMCGMIYMKKATWQIQNHHKNEIQLLNDLMAQFNQHIIHCAKLYLASCNNHPHPKIPESHFDAKKWTRKFLESSVKFIHQLIHFLEKPKKHQ